MKRKTLTNALAAGILAVVSGFAVQANAAFTFTQYGGFNNKDPNAANTPQPGQVNYSGAICSDASLCPVVAGSSIYPQMNWITGLPLESNLNLSTVTGPAALPDDGSWTTISTLTHTNNVIAGVINWSDQNVWGRFRILDEGGEVLDDTNAIGIDFNETLNLVEAAQCPAPNPQLSACDDFFTFTAVGLLPVDFQDSLGRNWRALFRLANLNNATALRVECASNPGLVEDGFGCDRIYTGERIISTLDVQASLERRPDNEIPEPSALFLVGLGLLGLGFGGLRRNKGNFS